MSVPVLYSFRRCPYAMRARLVLMAAGLTVELREIVLRDKPQQLLAVSPKGTVPVLVLADGQVIDESRDIVTWVAAQHRQLPLFSPVFEGGLSLLDQNDTEFKPWLDKYKYADRFPAQSQAHYRHQGEQFLACLEARLSAGARFLMGDNPSAIDLAIFPFVRQFAHVDKPWFDQCPYTQVHRWLGDWLDSELFASVMHKYPVWRADQPPQLFGPQSV
jgi:glutathione S-transferase